MRTMKSLVAVLGLMVASVFAIAGQTQLTSLDGTRVDVQGQRGKVVILALGASWLPLSNKQAEYTNMLAKRYTGKDVVVYFVATDSATPKSKNFATNADIEKFVAGSKLTVPVLRDSDGAVTLKKFNVDQLPSFVILDKQGNVSGSAFGGIDPKFDITLPISKAVDRLL
jgi:thiol-disulfide isomerase/thioredoxin